MLVVRSLRTWLLSATTLSMVVGYALLLGIHDELVTRERTDDHQYLVDALLAYHRSGSNLPEEFGGIGLGVKRLPPGLALPPSLEQGENGQTWLKSSTPFLALDGQSHSLQVRQNITATLAHNRSNHLTLMAGAGVSILLFAGLMRLVLWRGLLRPLRDLSDDMDGLNADELGEELLVVDQHPLELKPIASAFNSLQRRLASAWQRERQFVDGAAHELRTPITLISARSQRLLRPQPDLVQQQQDLVQIGVEASHIKVLITALLELSRSDSGRLRLDLQWCDPELQLLSAFERLSPLSPLRLQLAAASPNGFPAIRVDQERLQQCLLALVNNAFAYSEGLVQLSVTSQWVADQQWVALHVMDRGPGIPEHERNAVLQRFTRGTSAIGTRGSGIGLSITSELIKAMEAVLMMTDRRDGGLDVQLRFRV